MGDELHYGFKKVTPDNWSAPDMPAYFPEIDEQTWLSEITAPQLDHKVPEEIRALFECARALFVYGFLYYPLCALATEQLHRVAEAAAAAKCKHLGLPLTYRNKRGKLSPYTFSNNIDRLTARGGIAKSGSAWWQRTRKLRNLGSHPEKQTLLPPGMLLPIIKETAHNINQLFEHSLYPPVKLPPDPNIPSSPSVQPPSPP